MTFMERIPVRGTRPERLALTAVRRVYDGLVTTQAALPGTPDIALPGLRIAVSALGCFWHNHQHCPHARIPQTSYDWAGKFTTNRNRDVRNRDELAAIGWRTLWIWECALVGRDALNNAELDRLVRRFIDGDAVFAQIEGSGVTNTHAMPPGLDGQPVGQPSHGTLPPELSR